MRTAKRIGVITLKNGEMLEVEHEEYKKILASFAKSEMGKVYITSLKRMVDKTFIVDTQEKWVEDRNAVIVEERANHLLAEREHIVADGNGPGYKRFLAAKAKLKRKLGPSSR